MIPDLLTDDEHKAVHDAGQLYNLLCRIVGHGPSRDGDIRELIGHVHGIQQAVLKQAAARAYPDRYRLLGGMIGGGPMLPEVLAGRIATPDRCPSCEHLLAEFHQPEGCWFAVVRGTVGANLVCPCTVAYPRPEALPPTVGPAVQLQEVMRVGAVRVVEQIRLVHVRGDDEYCHFCHGLWPCPTIAIVESVEPWASLVRDGRVVQP